MPIIQTNNGNFHYESFGQGQPILFLHGSGASWKMWKPQIESFSDEYQMILLDYRGHGESIKTFPNNVYDYDLIVSDIISFLNALGLSQLHIIGVSQGAVLATLVAIHHPSYIKKLVISNSYSEFPTKTSEWVLQLSNFIFSLLPYSTIINLMMKIYKNEPYTQQILRESFSIDKKMLLMMKTAKFPVHTSLLHRIQSPTLILSGAGEVVSGVDEGKAGKTIHKYIPNSTLALFQDAFDPLNVMKKDIFNEMVLDFLKDSPLHEYTNVLYG
ncbi:alpha/beta hydrolase [Bacillus cytotoxicus]|uniref:alpha/beta fold hydrolase n=1 Tax=Bacillus cereus group sp. BfR-BA-01492 TaxID=2920361 RepID=UPI001F58E68A|nr:alpha/beta hydrolase [Bacillus cereus group sp. BfR-BA-01492]EMA6345043.1 alpha/beta hydrolase [Bacillus cytotoxicus]